MNVQRNFPKVPGAPGYFYDWRAQNHVFSDVGAYQQNTFNLATNENEPERYIGAICDHGFFAALEISPVLGRIFTDDEDQPGRDGVVILGNGIWKQRFGADPKIIGQNLILDGRPRTVIGVMPEGFQYPPQSTMWAPFGLSNETKVRRDFHRFRVIALLKSGVSLETARAELQTIGTRLARQYPFMNQDEGIAVYSMR